MKPMPFTVTAEGPVDLGALSTIERLREIAAYNLFDRTMREELDSICQRTAQRLDQPVGLVNIVLDGAQLVVGKSGLAGWIAACEGTPAEWAFCARVVMGEGNYVVPDAGRDEVQQHNPLYLMGATTAYAGVPLRAPNGQVLGAHCVVNDQPQEFTSEQLAVLEESAAEIMDTMNRYRRTPA